MLLTPGFAPGSEPGIYATGSNWSAQLVNGWKKTGVISRTDAGKINRCAALSSVAQGKSATALRQDSPDTTDTDPQARVVMPPAVCGAGATDALVVGSLSLALLSGGAGWARRRR